MGPSVIAFKFTPALFCLNEIYLIRKKPGQIMPSRINTEMSSDQGGDKVKWSKP